MRDHQTSKTGHGQQGKIGNSTEAKLKPHNYEHITRSQQTHRRGKALHIVLGRDTQTKYFDLAIVRLTAAAPMPIPQGALSYSPF